MTPYLARNDQSLLAQWWWTVDRLAYGLILLLICLGPVLSFAASPAVAEKIKLYKFYFAYRHIFFAFLSVMIVTLVSAFPPAVLRRLCILILFVNILFLIFLPFIGTDIKGSKRWISFFGFVLQPSEFIKPTFIVLTAWLFHLQLEKYENATKISFALYLFISALLLAQPDLGMTFLISLVWFTQYFLCGMPLVWIIAGGTLGFSSLTLSYFFFPHVQKRIDLFLFPHLHDRYAESYQIFQSLGAFMNGGLLGQGPGEGMIKKNIPDAHSDFILAVAGEEFGLIFCLLLLSTYLMVIYRCIRNVYQSQNVFLFLAVIGLSVQWGFQVLINAASTLGLIPTKGMTLPFISYGGSSTLSTALTAGLLLAFTKQSSSFPPEVIYRK